MASNGSRRVSDGPKTPQTPQGAFPSQPPLGSQATRSTQSPNSPYVAPLFPRSPAVTSPPLSLPQSPVTSPRNIVNASQSPQVSTPAAALQKLQISDPKRAFAARPGVGKQGKEFTVLVNMFKVNISGIKSIYRYEVKMKFKDMDDEKIPNRIRRRAITLLLAENGRWKEEFNKAASDYLRLMYSIKPLTDSRTTARAFEVVYYEEEQGPPVSGQEEFVTITLILQKMLDCEVLRKYLVSPAFQLADIDEYLAAFNAFVSRKPSQDRNFATTARSAKLFNINDSTHCKDVGKGLEVRRGFFKSVITSTSGLLLNLNSTAAVFYNKGSLQGIINKWNTGNPWIRRVLENRLRLLKVDTSYNGPQRRILFGFATVNNPNGPSVPTNAQVTFTPLQHPQTNVKNNQLFSIGKYFSMRYPNAPHVTPHGLVVSLSANPRRPCYVPADLCTVPAGQPYRRLLEDPMQAADMIRFACRKPSENAKYIRDVGLLQLGITAGSDGDLIKKFGIGISIDMLKVQARALQTPKLQYKQTQAFTAKGQWNLAEHQFYRGFNQVPKATCLTLLFRSEHSRPDNLGDFVNAINRGITRYEKFAQAYSLTRINSDVHELRLPEDNKQGSRDLLYDRLRYFKQQNIGLVFIILPEHNKEVYTTLKTVADTQVGIHTICTVVAPPPRQPRNHQGMAPGQAPTTGQLRTGDQAIANLILKFNLKFNGINHKLLPNKLYQEYSNNLMIVGADVTHPGQNAMLEAPSVAAVVANCDGEFFHYPGCIRLQRHQNDQKQAVESLEYLRPMLVSRLELYHKTTRKLPEKILIYRDGVSQGQFEMVMSKELPQIEAACKDFYPRFTTNMPKITLIVVQKRHHTRFFAPEQSNKSQHFDLNANPMPGMVVDRGITSERYFDFCITSHKCIQGTSRPAKYIVLHDDANMPADVIQQLTLDHCFLFGRSVTSISVHPAARYADLLCDRARLYMEEVYNCPMPRHERPTYNPTTHKCGTVTENLTNTMFYI